ncbi:MAG: ATP synthase F1 subunit epsilon [Thermoanaerobaculia bacterium]
MAEPGKIPSKILLTIVTRERKVLEKEVDEVVIPAMKGYLGVLPGHTPLLASLRVGELMYRIGDKAHHLVLAWGFAEVLPDRVIILAEGAQFPEEIDLEEAKRDRVEAERELLALASHEPEFALAEGKLDESIAEIQVVGKMNQ